MSLLEAEKNWDGSKWGSLTKITNGLDKLIKKEEDRLKGAKKKKTGQFQGEGQASKEKVVSVDSNLKKDMPKEIIRIAEFLDIQINEEKWHDILHHCSFDYMKTNATPSVPLGGAFWDGGAEQFIYKGVNGRWRESLNSSEINKYDNLALKELGKKCATWLTTGDIS